MNARDRVLDIDPEMLFLEPAEFDSAIIGAYVGDKTPVFVTLI